MKTVRVALCIFVLLLAGIGAGEHMYQKQTEKIVASCKVVYPFLRAENKSAAADGFSVVRTAFYDCEKWWSAVADHNRLENMEAKLREAENMLKTGDFKGAENNLRLFCLLLQNYQENMEIKWYNIL